MSLIKHSSFNLAGNIIPALVSIPALGYMARTLGVELFGVFTLAIAIVGYAGIFDGGLTRAVVREVAMFRNDPNELQKIISSSTFMIVILSFVAMFSLYASSSEIVAILNISREYSSDAKKAITILALSVPFFLLSQVWLSILEGKENFSQLNIQRSIGSVFLSGLPVFFIFYNPSLVSAMFGLLSARVFILVISIYSVRKELSSSKFRLEIVTAKRLISYGGWITISNIISPVMSYFDRFIASNLLGAQNIAFYTAPAELISKGLIIPAALTRALFPKLISATEKNRIKLRRMSYLILSIICGSGVILGMFLAEKVMTLWMGSEFSGQPVVILKILLTGYFFNAIAQLPFSDIQAYGKAKWTALVHMVELFPYLFLIYFLINKYGLIGVAIAWSMRAFFDFIILAMLSLKLNKRFKIT